MTGCIVNHPVAAALLSVMFAVVGGCVLFELDAWLRGGR